MKRFLLCMLTLLLVLGGCKADEEPPAEVPAPEWVIVVPDGYDSKTFAVAGDIKAAVKRVYGKNISILTDKAVGNAKGPEILVGHTNRDASVGDSAKIGTGGWWVASTEGALVVNARTVKGLREAADYFIKNLKYEDGVLSVSEKAHKEDNGLLAAETTLRVGSFNIKHGELDPNMEQLAALIKAEELDIVGLQEVDMNTSRVGGRNTLKLLADAAGYPYYEFVKAIDYGGGEYGTAIISKYPITSVTVTPLYQLGTNEKRSLGYATVNVKGEEVHFFNTHLALTTEERAEQFRTIAAAVEEKNGFIVTGDFNTADLGEFTPIKGCIFGNNGKFATFPGRHSAIDEIVLHPHWHIVENGMVETALSDHNLLWAEIKYTGGFAS